MNRKQIRALSHQLASVKPKQKVRFVNMLSHFKQIGLEQCLSKQEDPMSSTDKRALQSAIIELQNEKLNNPN